MGHRSDTFLAMLSLVLELELELFEVVAKGSPVESAMNVDDIESGIEFEDEEGVGKDDCDVEIKEDTGIDDVNVTGDGKDEFIEGDDMEEDEREEDDIELVENSDEFVF